MLIRSKDCCVAQLSGPNARDLSISTIQPDQGPFSNPAPDPFLPPASSLSQETRSFPLKHALRQYSFKSSAKPRIMERSHPRTHWQFLLGDVEGPRSDAPEILIRLVGLNQRHLVVVKKIEGGQSARLLPWCCAVCARRQYFYFSSAYLLMGYPSDSLS